MLVSIAAILIILWLPRLITSTAFGGVNYASGASERSS
jgi:hypothetical protein